MSKISERTQKTLNIRKFNILMIGNVGCGKSSIIQQSINKKFGSLPTTIGVEFNTKTTFCVPNETINLDIWDLAGQDSFSAVQNVYYRQADGIFFVYDCMLNTAEQENSLKKWVCNFVQPLHLWCCGVSSVVPLHWQRYVAISYIFY